MCVESGYDSLNTCNDMQIQPTSDGDWWTRFRELLDDQNDWPATYTFKFIVPTDGLDAMKAVFDGHPLRVRASSKGNYVSVTARMMMPSSEAVIDVYRAAASVEGVISL